MPFVIHFLFVLLNAECIFEAPAFSNLKNHYRRTDTRRVSVLLHISFSTPPSNLAQTSSLNIVSP